MPIIRNLKKDFEEGRMDNLRSISFKDTGTEAPYVTKPIGSKSDQVTKRIDDLARMGKMLLDRPGLEHLAKEGILKQGEITDKLRRNEKYKNGTDVGNFLRRATGTLEHLLLVTGSTLAQVPVNGTGTHFVRGFKRDTYLQESAGFKTPVDGSTYSIEGARIPMTEVNSESKLPTKNTTAVPGDLGKLNIGTEGDLKPSYGEEGTIKPKYSALSTFTDTTTELNVEKSSTGTGINIQTERSEDTTVAKETLGISNESREGTIGSTFVRKNKYSSTNSTEFLGSNSEKNNLLAQRGYPINPGSSVGDVTINGVTTEDLFIPSSFTTAVSGSFGVDNKDVDFNISNLDQKFATVFEIGDTKTKLTTPENITAASSEIKVIPLKKEGKETTSQIYLSQPNDFDRGDITELNPKTENRYTEGSTFTNSGTLTNVNNVQTGASIPKPEGLNKNTTASPKTFGVLNKDIEGDISEQIVTSSYSSDNVYTGTNTVDNINNIRNGSATNNPTETSKQTTAAKEQFGITNTGIEGDTTSLLNKEVTKFEVGDKKSKLDTQGNILAAQPLTTGSIINIPLTDSPIPDDFVDGQMSREIYSSESTYTGEKAEDHISILKHGDGITAGIANRDNLNDDTVAGSSQSIPGRLDTESATYNQIISSTKVEDFRKKDVFGGGIRNTYSFDYNDETINKEKRVGLGNPGKKSRLRTSYTVDDPDTVDKINKLDVSKEPLDGIKENRDLIQLEFQVITPEETYYLAFRAFLETFDDSFNASWNSSKYLGRADSFYTYNGFERSINIGFKIAAQSREEMKPLYRKAATLASVTAPSYGTGGRFMRGTIAKVTVGDYIYEQPGIIESVQYSWQKDYPWEISFQNPEKEGSKDQILPHVLDVTISFKVIHDFLPETGVTPFITNHNPIKGNKETYIPLVDREFIIPETRAEKRERLAKEEAAKKEAAAKAKIAADNKEFREKGLVGPLLEDPVTPVETVPPPGIGI